MRCEKRFKIECINLQKSGALSLEKIALKKQISRQTLARWLALYEKYGEQGLENRRPGVKETPINPNFERLVLTLWRKGKRSTYKMRKDLKKDVRRNGYTISEREIKKVYRKHKLQVNLS